VSLALHFHPRVRTEMDEAYAWYESQRAGRGEDFLAAVREALDQIQEYPEMHPTVHRDIRRILIRRFPYGVYFTVGASHIWVIAVYHGKRDPAGWKSRN
jgi:plasmid stabilization system protein ParE